MLEGGGMYEIPNWAAVMMAFLLLGLGFSGGLGRGKERGRTEMARQYFPHWDHAVWDLGKLEQAEAALEEELRALRAYRKHVKNKDRE
jgi:hypothetical protein